MANFLTKIISAEESSVLEFAVVPAGDGDNGTELDPNVVIGRGFKSIWSGEWSS